MLLLACCQYLCMTYIQPISRRLLNISYVCWLLFCNIFLISALLFFHLCLSHLSQYIVYTSYIVEVLNSHALLFFIVSNLLTGAVNVTIDTLAVNDTVAIVILIVYVLSSVAVVTVYHEYYYGKQQQSATNNRNKRE